MIEGTKIALGAWVLHNSDTGHNMSVLLGEGGAALVNPGSDSVEIAALARFLLEQERAAQVLVYTEGHEGTLRQLDDEADLRWPEAVLLTYSAVVDAPFQPVTVFGWEVISLASEGRLGLLHRRERILLCGPMLAGQNPGIPSLDGGAENYIEALDSIESLGVKLVVPARGLPARGKREIRSRIEHDRNYAYSVARHVASALGSRVPLERVLEVATQVYEDYPHRDAHIDNIRRVWKELSTGTKD